MNSGIGRFRGFISNFGRYCVKRPYAMLLFLFVVGFAFSSGLGSIHRLSRDEMSKIRAGYNPNGICSPGGPCGTGGTNNFGCDTTNVNNLPASGGVMCSSPGAQCGWTNTVNGNNNVCGNNGGNGCSGGQSQGCITHSFNVCAQQQTQMGITTVLNCSCLSGSQSIQEGVISWCQ
jgi:hypothetical protein